MTTPAALAERIDAIERAYEYMLGYAGQDRASDRDGQPCEIRDHLKRADEAFAALAQATLAGLGLPDKPGSRAAYEAFVEVVREDARKSREAVALALRQPDISSRLIDNVNALVHIRALITDLFVIDEALKGAA
jgi:hypothetical protein